MGAKESKQFPLTYEEALKRVTEAEKRRLQDAFRRLSASSGHISRHVFIKEVVGDALPPQLSDQIFFLCNGGHNNGSNGHGYNGNGGTLSSSSGGGGGKGLNFREVLCYLVLITRGTREEKIKFIYGLFAPDSGAYVEKSETIKHVKEWENGFVPEPILLLFSEDKVTYDEFCRWIDVPANAESLGVSRWLLFPNANLSLINKTDTPTFYQTLAGVTHLEELEVVELEKRFWELASHSTSNQIDLVTITPMISPPLPSSLVTSFFMALDENEDGHIDFKELSCGMSAACRGPEMERQKFCFKIFDRDKDGQLNREEMRMMLQAMIEVRNQTLSPGERINPDIEKSVDEILHNGKVTLSIEDYLVWTAEHKELPTEFAKLLYQLCHVVLGLRPPNRQAEGDIVAGWLDREEKAPHTPGQVWYLLNMDWWNQWSTYVHSVEVLSKKAKQISLDSDAAGSNHVNQVDSMTENHGLRPPTLSTSSSGGCEGRSSTAASANSTPMHSPHPLRKNTNVINRPGLIDNSNLLQTPSHKITSLTGEGGRLKPSLKLIRGKDYELIPERLWKALIEWYGGAPAIPRQVIRNNRGEVELELHPLSIKLFKHQSVPRQANHVPTVVGGYSAAAIHATGAAFSGLGTTPPSTTRRYHAHNAAFSRRTTVVTIENFLCQRFCTKTEDLRLWHFKDESHMRLLVDANAVLEEIGIRDDDTILVEVRSRDGTWPEEISSLVTTNNDRRSSTAPLNSAVQNVPGITGLNNLGNTCYMNAALQCVSNTKILAKYFQKNCHLHELNRTNPLGFHGHVAKRFGDLVRDMWSQSTSKTIAPIKMRWTISRYSQNFSGFQQHDSQELLAFLLDGLHEDLNRVMIKPYDELKDSDGRPDDVVAGEAWENHIRRNQSVIVDLFHGQLKSKVTCKVCGHESVKFDPFTYLSLPLPMESSIHLEVIVIRQNGTVPVKYGLTLDMEAKYADIKPRLSRLSRIPADNLILVDIVQSQFRIDASDDQKLKGLNGTCIFAYEFRPLISRDAAAATTSTSSSVAGAETGPKSSDTPQTLSDIQRGTVSLEDVPKRGHARSSLSCDSSKVTSSSEPFGKSQPVKDAEEDSEDRMEEVKLSLSNESSSKDDAALLKCKETKSVHSRQSSQASTASMEMRPSRPNAGLGDCHKGLIMPQEVYFLSTEKYRPVIFGLPLIIPCFEGTTYRDIYQAVWTQVNRLVSPLPPRDSSLSQNHALDCDDSLGYEYPFVLKVVQEGGSFCAWCPWHRFCRGCDIPCTTKEFSFCASYIAIDWDQTALHLRYLSSQEKAFVEDTSVEASLKAATEPITLKKCLEAFTRQEELGENEKYYCSACKKHQLASKKLQIWRLPPILIVHLKRFHFVNGRWIKSHKIVDFPNKEFDPTDYLAAIPQQTIRRHRELVNLGSRVRSTIVRSSQCNGTIREGSESSITDQGSSLEDEETEEELHTKYQNLDDSAVGQSDSSGLVASLGDEEEEDEDLVFDENNEQEKPASETPVMRKNVIFSPSAGRRRSRQQSTSLMRHPIEDDNLKDYHEHRSTAGKDPFDISYSLYSVICHSGVLGGGHYISYSKSTAGKWYCLNDSACKEIKEEAMEKGNAYMLFYERDGLSVPDYLPKIDSKLLPDTKDLEDELEVDFKKHCCLM